MVVYRVEKPNGRGPYSKGNSSEAGRKLLGKHQLSNNHPLPDEDGIPCNFYARPEYFCGFHSKELYNEWFGDVFDILAELECSLCEYEAALPDIMFGRKQLVFLKGKAELISKTRIYVNN